MSFHDPHLVKSRVAVFVDGDNISAAYADEIMAIARKSGRPDLLRVYADAVRKPQWRKVPGFKSVDAGAAKNGADLLLCIDVMDTAHVGGFDTFVVVSDDGDFTHLALRLRERGIRVIGVGTQDAKKCLGACFTAFEPLKSTVKAKDCNAGEIEAKVIAVIKEHAHPDGGLPIQQLGLRMSQIHALTKKNIPESGWAKYAEQRSELFRLEKKGPQQVVFYVGAR